MHFLQDVDLSQSRSWGLVSQRWSAEPLFLWWLAMSLRCSVRGRRQVMAEGLGWTVFEMVNGSRKKGSK